jgi:hypothetical protein
MPADWAQARSRALHWVETHLVEFDPFQGGQTFNIQRGQRIAELATMLRCYTELSGDRESSAVARIVALLQAGERASAFRDRVLRQPAEFALFAHVYGVLYRLGHEDPEQRAAIQRFIDLGLLNHTQRLPHQVMEVRQALDLGEFTHRWPNWDAMYAGSLLAQPLSPLYLDQTAIYAVTHILLFYYGFGPRPPGGAPAAQSDTLRHLLAMLMIRVSQEHHWDLLGELLLCWDCLGLADSEVTERAWTTFLGQQRDDGAFPGPERSVAGRRLQETIADPAEYQATDFAHHYHTTLVGIIATSKRLARRAAGDVESSIPATLPHAREDDPEPGEDIAAALRLARGWLEQRLERAERATSPAPDALCHIVLGCWICDTAISAEQGAFAEVAQRAGRILGEQETAARADRVPATLRLLCATLLASQGKRVPVLQDFLAMVATLLRATPPETAPADLALTEKRSLLHTLGLHPPPALLDYTELQAVAQAFSLSSSPTEVDTFLLHLYSYTGYGTRPATLDPAGDWIGELLCGLTMHFFREYDLPLGCRLLQVLSYLGQETRPGFDSCMRFLLAQQRPDGSFGFFGPEEGAIRENAGPGFSWEEQVILPMTVRCLWTLVEAAGGGWRLFAALPRYAGP